MSTSLEQAAALHQHGQLAQAIQAYRNLLASNPNHFEALYLLGVALHQSGQISEALSCFDRAIAIEPHKIMPHYSRGNALRALGQPAQALLSYERALELKPDFADALYSRGNALVDLEQPEAALLSYERALEFKPDHFEAWLNRSNVLRTLKRWGEALSSCQRALALQPNSKEANLSQGNVLQDLKRLNEALSSYNRALAIAPDYAQALCNRGNVLRAMNQPQQALASYQQALRVQPQDAGAHWNESLCHLLLGDFPTGWRLYEWRWQAQFAQKHLRAFPQPLWLGQVPLQGKTILLHAEQGFGDTLQFCRYAALVTQQGAKVVLEVQPSLVRLLSQLNVAQVIAQGEPLPVFDYHCPLLSLPLAFKTELTSIPAGSLAANAADVKTWKKRLGRNPKKLPRIGLAWAGNPIHPNDHNRSIALAQLLPLVSSTPAQFFSLQKELRAGDAQLLAKQPNIHLLGETWADFADTAAVMELLDVVITVDAAIAHLAGALGKKVWVLLPYAPDWRWLLERNDSPWYPSMRLLRQHAVGDWAGVLEQVRSELANEFESTTT